MQFREQKQRITWEEEEKEGLRHTLALRYVTINPFFHNLAKVKWKEEWNILFVPKGYVETPTGTTVAFQPHFTAS